MKVRCECCSIEVLEPIAEFRSIFVVPKHKSYDVADIYHSFFTKIRSAHLNSFLDSNVLSNVVLVIKTGHLASVASEGSCNWPSDTAEIIKRLKVDIHCR